MCEQESHQEMPQPKHFIAHVLEVERGCADYRLGRELGETGLNSIVLNAKDALALDQPSVTDSCRRMLTQAALGNIERAAARQKQIKLS